MHIRPESETLGQLVELRPGATAIIGGSRERLKNDWQVKPAGRFPCIPVTNTTPLAKCPTTARK
jgi:hypothetical protein